MKQFKKCGLCQVTKSADKFYKCKSRHDGLRGQCILCCAKVTAKSRLKTGKIKTTNVVLD